MTNPGSDNLDLVTGRLRELYGPLSMPALSPLEFVLLENASYLVDDRKRWQVFERLRDSIGLTPRSILKHGRDSVASAIVEGGMKPLMRAGKVLECARIAEEIGLEKLNAAVKEGRPSAKRLLRRFPGIGEPAADRILLFCGPGRSPAPDSNALRVMIRLGFGSEQKNYAGTYQSAVAALEPQIGNSEEAIEVHLLFRRHGLEVCKRTMPRCEVCPLRSCCLWYRRLSEQPTVTA